MKKQLSAVTLLAVAATFSASAFAAAAAARSGVTCPSLPTFAQVQIALGAAVTANAGANGFGLPSWVTLIDSTGLVCAVAQVAGTDPWPGSRVISAQKANTANSFSTNQIALSTANLYSAVQPGGSLYGLQHSNPVNTLVAYRGSAANFGTASDPMVGLRVGGVNVFGGGLALYNAAGQAIGAIGVSGDTSCADHNNAWLIRETLVGKGTGSGVVANTVPGGFGFNGTDNIVYDIIANPNGGSGKSASGWGHPSCTSTTIPVSVNTATHGI